MSLVAQKGDVKVKKKSSKGCWTCKRRKIGCDKQLPVCNNCLRTGRCCAGYGIKVQWPETADGRRPLCSWEAKAREKSKFVKVAHSGDFHFLNTTFDDLQSQTASCSLGGRRSFRFQPSPTIARSLTVGFDTTDLMPEDTVLLSYYHEVLSRMITTIDDSRNGFRTILIPRALAGQSISSQSLREAILALSAFHLWGHQSALKHKLKAIRLLSASIGQEKELVSQFSTCMMLCVCDVFDAADGSWYNHLRAAKILCTQAKAAPTGGHTTYFLTTWMSYHQVLAEFSQIPENWKSRQIVPQFPNQDTQNKVASDVFHGTPSPIALQETHTNQIIGSLGCSMQLLESISCITQLSHLISQSPSKSLPSEYSSIPYFLQAQLESLQQIPEIVEDSTSGQLNECKILNTAEFYRLAALIYLHRSIISSPPDSVVMRDLVAQSLDILQKVEICTSPWPLFMTACEVVGDNQRIMVLDAIERMQKERRIGNVEIVRNIIEAAWKQADLYPRQEGKTRVDWKSLVSVGKSMPSFI